MDDGILSPTTMFGASVDIAMDFDLIDELLLEGCWLETTDGSEFLRPSSSNSSTLVNPFFNLGNSEIEVDLSTNLTQNNNQEDREELQEKNTVNTLSPSPNTINVSGYLGQSEKNYTNEGSDLGKRWWIQPKAHPGPASSVIDRLIKAIGYIQDTARDKDLLIQVWVPVNRGGKRVLTTNDLPFSLNCSSERLARYRDISANYQFSAEGDSKEVRGLPGRVFLQKVPEWTPDVQFFRSDEYPRVSYAQQCDVRGTLALPVFEQGSRTCLGVIEVVMTTQQIKYQSELEIACKALEAVDLRSSNVLSTPNLQASSSSYQAVLPEIREVLKFTCETYKLPLAQTWASCVQQGREGCLHSDENYIHCISTVDDACYVADPYFKPFHEACSEHHLLKGQGVSGRAFMTNQPCFFADITSFGKSEYPLSHHARMFELHAAVAIRLRSIYTSKAYFVLEFFFPVGCRDPEEQRKMLTLLSIIIQESCRALRAVTDKELEEETNFPLERKCNEDSSGGNLEDTLNERHLMFGQHERDSDQKGLVEGGEEGSTVGEHSLLSVGTSKTWEKRHNKPGNTITLQVLRQYFSGSLKDAAKSLGVCPTTLKRICRQHGITRWPSRKIKKVGHSLQKLRHVIDSVRGASSAFQINSLHTNFAKLVPPNPSGVGPFFVSAKANHQNTSGLQDEHNSSNLPAVSSKSLSSSCSQSTSSSHCCSSQEGWNVMPTSPDHKSLSKNYSSESLVLLAKNSPRVSDEEKIQRVKVTYGDEKVRFRLHSKWGFRDLVEEIARRFDISEISTVDIRYLDDDSEWVLLTCDDDLVECIDVYKTLRRQMIKLSVQVSRRGV